MICIDSDRIKLIPLKHHQLLYFEHRWNQLQCSLSLNVSPAIQMDNEVKMDVTDALKHFWLPNTKAYPELYCWYTNWLVVLKSQNRAIGGINFNGYPDDYGETTIAYVTDQRYQGRGYATEAVKALCQWGFKFSVLKTIKADTTSTNYSSQKVLLKAGFSQTDTQAGTVYFTMSKRNLAIPPTILP